LGANQAIQAERKIIPRTEKEIELYHSIVRDFKQIADHGAMDNMANARSR
jgi:hypothetical protein